MAIPLDGRMIGFCEAFASMASPSSYKQPLSWDAALREVDDCTGTQFDPDVTRAFKVLVDHGAIDPSFLP